MLNKQRENNRIIVGFVITIFLFMLLVGILFIPIYSNIVTIGEQKIVFNNLYSIQDNLNNKGLPYSITSIEKTDIPEKKGFSDLLKSDTNLSQYSKQLLTYNKLEDTGISSKNYSEFMKPFIAGEFKSFEDFIRYKTTQLLGEESKAKLKLYQSIIGKILPKYDDGLNLSGENIENSLSNVDFVNKIEQLLNKHDLVTNSKIGISQIVKVDEGSKKTNSKVKKEVKSSGFESSLYYIPLKLDLDGDKKDILALFKDLESFGNLYNIKVKDENVLSYKDSKGNLVSIIKTNSKGDLLKNINSYEQLVKIESVEMSEYIDDEITRNNNTLIEAINNNQSNNDFNLSLSLNFYISGISNFELSNSIKKVLGNIQDVKLVENISALKSKKRDDLSQRELQIIDYYNTKSYLGVNQKELGDYNKLKIRIQKYIDTISGESGIKKYGQTFVDKKLSDLNSLKKKVFDDYYTLDIKKILSDNDKGNNIKQNYLKVENYIYKFSLIENELNLIHNSLYNY